MATPILPGGLSYLLSSKLQCPAELLRDGLATCVQLEAAAGATTAVKPPVSAAAHVRAGLRYDLRVACLSGWRALAGALSGLLVGKGTLEGSSCQAARQQQPAI